MLTFHTSTVENAHTACNGGGYTFVHPMEKFKLNEFKKKEEEEQADYTCLSIFIMNTMETDHIA